MHNRGKKTEDTRSTSANSGYNTEQQSESTASDNYGDAYNSESDGLKRRIFAGSPKRDEDYLN